MKLIIQCHVNCSTSNIYEANSSAIHATDININEYEYVYCSEICTIYITVQNYEVSALKKKELNFYSARMH